MGAGASVRDKWAGERAQCRVGTRAAAASAWLAAAIVRVRAIRRPGSSWRPRGDERTRDGAREELHRPLDRMGVDHVDLWQLHALADPIEWDIALSPGGVIEAAVQAREEGLVGWISVTGHGTQIAATYRRSLDRFGFGSVLLPYNYLTMQNSYYAANFDALYAPAGSGTWRSRRSSRSPGAPGSDGRAPGRPGTSRSPSRTTSTWRCGGR